MGISINIVSHFCGKEAMALALTQKVRTAPAKDADNAYLKWKASRWANEGN